MTIKFNRLKWLKKSKKRRNKKDKQLITITTISLVVITGLSMLSYIMYLQAVQYYQLAELRNAQVKTIQQYYDDSKGFRNIITMDESCMTQLKVADFVQLKVLK